ncbi:MATE family efflux transporter [Aeromicrobium sp. 50.2.37]|uniref:MATE family efflux transporter n=1 Tax=Aeromicrobium sp. 50.2.37 TaxID=2969305 RepID=UPI0021504EB5|nr:MATE family efflux transporter [Aeromicrobium sp. 50.2.37]MCR4514920.1 MATE family efflux transporter [Aeromicrobium sp. 50.2.37]
MNKFGEQDRRIVAVAVPAFFALVSEPLMLLADTAIVGRLGTSELGGLAVASSVLLTVVGLCVFLAYGSTATVGRLHGAGQVRAAYDGAAGGLWLAVGLGVVLGALVAATRGPVSGALGSSRDVEGLASTYLLISASAVPAMLLVLAATGALRGVLDLRTPLLVTVLANVLNVVLSLVLVHGLDLGIAGAAVGTAVAQWVAAGWLVLVVVRRARAAGSSGRPNVAGVVAAARDGVPLLARTATLRAALLLGTAVAATFGDAPLAAHQIATSLVSFLAFAMDAVAIAGQTLTGRTLGAGDADGTRALTRRMIAWGIGTGLAAGVLLLALAPFVGGWFTPDAAVHDALVPALVVVAAVQPISGVVFVLDGVLIGAGDGVYLAWAGLAVLLAYAPLALLAGSLGAGLAWLWAAYGVFQLARLVTLWLRQRGTTWMVLGA